LETQKAQIHQYFFAPFVFVLRFLRSLTSSLLMPLSGSALSIDQVATAPCAVPLAQEDTGQSGITERAERVRTGKRAI
jgi:hypothetical protein